MKPSKFPDQNQHKQPGLETEMSPEPEVIRKDYTGSHKLKDKVAVITGGDSGIGRAVAVHFAREDAKGLAIIYLDEKEDALETRNMAEAEGVPCMLIQGDIRNKTFCQDAIKQTVEEFGKLDVLVNNAAVHYPEDSLPEITTDDLVRTFETNVFSMFYLTQEALHYMKDGARIINTTSVVAYRGSTHLIDYAATKGAITSFTRSLAGNLAKNKRNILVNAVAPGPIWTPLIPAAFDDVTDFGSNQPLGRAGQPSEVAPAYVYLASADSSYMTGQVLHINGGEVVGG